MKFELSLPDDTSPDIVARTRDLLSRLESDPSGFFATDTDLDALIQSKFTPEVEAYLDRIKAEMSAGNYLTEEQVVESLRRKKEEWIRRKANSA